MKVFLTGATGFIGAYVLRELLSQGHDLLCLKRKLHRDSVTSRGLSIIKLL